MTSEPNQNPEESTALTSETTPLLSPPATASNVSSETPREQPWYRRILPTQPNQCLYLLLATLVFLVVGTPLVYYVIMPRTAQSVLDSSELFLDSVELSDPRIDGTSLNIHIIGRIVTHGGLFVPSVQAVTEPADLQVLDENFSVLGRFCMPPLTVRPGAHATRFEVNTELTVLNSTALAAFGKKLVNEREVYWNVEGHVKVKLFNGYLSFRRLNFRKTISLNGMGGMNETKLLAFDLPSDHPSGGIRLFVSAAFQNPSNVRMDLPSGLYMAIDLPENGSTAVRLAILESPGSVQIVPGTNNLTLHGRILSYRDSPNDLRRISKFFSETVTGKTATVVVQGLGIQGGKPIWLNKALIALSVPVNVPPQPKMKIVDSLNILSMGMKFTKELAYNPLTTGKVRASIIPPFGFPIRVLAIAQSLDFFDIPDDAENIYSSNPDRINAKPWIVHAGRPFAHMTTPFVNVTSPESASLYSVKPIVIEAVLPPSHLTVYPDRKVDFSKFMVSMFERDTKKVLIAGTTSAVVDTAIGNVELRDVELEEAITLVGMSSLHRVPANITAMDIVASSKSSIVTHSDIMVYSPANVDASLGRVSLALSHCPENETHCTHLGEAVVNTLDVREGWNGLSVVGEITGGQERKDEWTRMGDGVRRFLGKYVSGLPLNLTIHGHARSSEVPSVLPLLMQLRLNEKIPPMPTALLSAMRFHALSDTSSFTLNNPMLVPISIIAIRANTTFRNQPVGSLNVDLRDPQADEQTDRFTDDEISPYASSQEDRDTWTVGKHKRHKAPAFVVPPLSTDTSPHWPVKLPRTGPGFELIKEVLRTGGILSLDVYVRCYIGVGEWRGWIDALWENMEAFVVLDA